VTAAAHTPCADAGRVVEESDAPREHRGTLAGARYAPYMDDAADRTVRSARAADVPELGSVLGRAFAEAPQFVWLLPDEALRARAQPDLFRIVVRSMYPVETSEVLVERGAISGGAVWAPPGWRASAWRQLRALPAMIVAFGLGHLRDFGRRGQAMEEALRAARPSEPHWYLGILGTHPAASGRGVGSALMRSGVARCDREPAPAYLECFEDLVPFYERFGFRATGRIEMPDEVPPQVGMWRPRR
jgi:GNAT superfamily N-acetyltransferase